jgi:parvulin-like peptidyl-prolyl isomerase
MANASQVSSRRSFVLMGSGALLGLLLAGYSLFTARGTSTLIVPPEDVALVNQQPISRSDYLLQLQTLYNVDLQHATVAQRRKVLDDMIREELFVQRGKELDVASTDPDVRAAMVNSVELEIAADAITAQPSEPQLRAYYALHRARYASEGIMTVRDFVFPLSESSAAAAAAETLKISAPTPALLARWHAADSGKVSGEEFYFAAKIHLGEALFQVARNLPDGGVSAPIARADAIHVLYMLENKKPVPFEFTAARDQVLTDYRNDAIGRLRTGDEAFLRKRANVLIADDVR